MSITNFLTKSATLSSPPPGSINVLVGEKIEGPGGRWIPCATRTADGSYYSGLFQVGPGQRQVCASSITLDCPKEALSRAIALASSAAA
ncbi:hypothetical protein [Yoonia sp.]|uniref:hypothetical protein n=1 Tax=Yoonia sp. TaxID=2212373 RepID=UPI003975DCD9